jgi:hypothetical protein
MWEASPLAEGASSGAAFAAASRSYGGLPAGFAGALAEREGGVPPRRVRRGGSPPTRPRLHPAAEDHPLAKATFAEAAFAAGGSRYSGFRRP